MRKILFVDDMSVCCREFMRGISGGSSVYWAKTRDEALMQIGQHPLDYDLVISDWHLGESYPDGGREVITTAYKTGIPVISISKDDEHKNEALEAGAKRFMFKKEFFNNIEKTISEILEK